MARAVGAAERPGALTSSALLAGLTRLGPHFALVTHPVGSVPDDRWRPFEDLLDTLDGRVAAVRAALATAGGRSPDEVELRVAVSMTQLALTGRLVCPALGTAVLTDGLLDLDPARLRWQPGPGTAVALSVPAQLFPSLHAGRTDSLTEALADTVLAGPVRRLVEACSRYGVSAQVLWGNVASVVHGAPGLIGAGAPELLAPAQALAAGLLELAPLRGTSRGGPGPGFRRRSCCLVYRLVPVEAERGSTGAPAGICGDCVLERLPGERRL